MKFPPEEETPKRDCRWKHYQWPVGPTDEDAAEEIENHDTNSPLKPRERGAPQRLDNTPTKAHSSSYRMSTIVFTVATITLELQCCCTTNLPTVTAILLELEHDLDDAGSTILRVTERLAL